MPCSLLEPAPRQNSPKFSTYTLTLARELPASSSFSQIVTQLSRVLMARASRAEVSRKRSRCIGLSPSAVLGGASTRVMGKTLAAVACDDAAIDEPATAPLAAWVFLKAAHQQLCTLGVGVETYRYYCFHCCCCFCCSCDHADAPCA